MNTTAKYILIGLGAAGAGYLVYRYLIKKNHMGASNTSSGPSISGFKRVDQPNSIILIPNDPNKAKQWLFVYPGIPPYGGSWIEGQIPESLKDRYAFVIAKGHQTEYSKLKAEATATLPAPSWKGIVGFSGGGTKTQENMADGFSFVGLIDPSTNTRFLSNNWSGPKKVVMMYYRPNWGSKYQSIKDAQVKIAEAIKKAGGIAVEKQIKHLEYPKAFMAEHL